MFQRTRQQTFGQSSARRFLPLLLVVVGGVFAPASKAAAPPASRPSTRPDQLTLIFPTEFQVFQRKTSAAGPFRVDGRAPAGITAVRWRITGASITGDLDAPWHAVAVDKTGEFRDSITISAGGWYGFEIESLQGETTVETKNIKHVGVGEVFVIAGQSNATNYGETPQEITTGLVSNFDGATWQLANDPQPGVQDKSRRGSFIPAFGDAMARKYKVPIGIACVGHGSTSVRQWLPRGERIDVLPTMSKYVRTVSPGQWEADGTLFDGMMKRVDQLGPGGFRALLWHQGESDANQSPDHNITGEQYRQLMEKLIRAAGARAGRDFPWIVAQASYHTPSDPSCPPIRQAQKSLWENGFALEGPDTDTLIGPLREHGGKGVHFSADGLVAHGRLWADKVGAHLDKMLDADDRK